VKKVLLIQTAFIGDVILATPIVSELHRIFPGIQIDVLVKKGNESLLKNNPKINQTYVFDKKEGKYKNMFKLIKSFRGNNYDLCINLHRFASSGIIAGLSGAKKIYGFKKNPFSFTYSKKFNHEIGNGKHEVERNLQVIQEFGAKSILRPELFPSKNDFSKVEKYKNDDYYCISPASVWHTKQLPESKWVELINKLPKTAKIYLLGGPSDKELCNRIKENSSNEKVTVLAGQLSLMESTALLKDTKRSYVNDSGPLHLSSSMNAPVTSYFCSTVPDFGFGPLSDDSEIKQVANLSCRPCGLHGHKSCPKGHFKCGQEMDV